MNYLMKHPSKQSWYIVYMLIDVTKTVKTLQIWHKNEAYQETGKIDAYQEREKLIFTKRGIETKQIWHSNHLILQKVWTTSWNSEIKFFQRVIKKQ